MARALYVRMPKARAHTLNMSRVVGLQICPGHRLPMKRMQSIRAITDFGLEQDSHAQRGGSRQVLLMPLEVIQKLGIEVGDVRENITTIGLDFKALRLGTRLQVGEVELEIARACEPCSRMDEIRTGLREQLGGQRGVLAKVIRGGEIRLGDSIQIVEESREVTET